jgi:hypothetical protein
MNSNPAALIACELAVDLTRRSCRCGALSVGERCLSSSVTPSRVGAVDRGLSGGLAELVVLEVWIAQVGRYRGELGACQPGQAQSRVDPAGRAHTANVQLPPTGRSSLVLRLARDP